MTTNDIGKIIKKFIESKESAIIIDGNWGIGKTCSIDNFLKYEKDKDTAFDDCVFHYISLFGFKDIDTLHKELYKKFHPFLVMTAKALSYISLAEPIMKWKILFNTDKAKEDICKKQEKGSLHKKYKSNVIIFDDLERVATQKDGFIELMGYFNRLIKEEEIKIICICNSNEIETEKRDIFDNFKEKIFDRTYTINEENIEVIKKIFKETYDLLDSESISFFEKNLRLVNKTKIFIDDVFEQLSANKSKEKFEKRILCLICILIVKEVFGSDLSKEFEEELQEKMQSDNNIEKNNAEVLLKEKATDTDGFKIKAIVGILQKQQIRSKYDMVYGLYNYFKYCDDSYFTHYELSKRLLPLSLFYYDDNEKKDIVEDVLSKIYKHYDDYDADQISGAISDVCQYGGEFVNNDDYNKLAYTIIGLKDEKKKENIISNFDIDYRMLSNDNLTKFSEILDQISQEAEKEEFIDYFKNFNVNNYNDFLFDWTRRLRDDNKHLIKEMCDYLKSRSFFIPDLSKTISRNAWNFCNAICDFIVEFAPDYNNALIDIFENQIKENPNSICLKDRMLNLKERINGCIRNAF